MDSRSPVAGNPLLHVDLHIDEHEPCRGILDLLSILRPQWKAEDVQLKASECVCLQISGIHRFYSKKGLQLDFFWFFSKHMLVGCLFEI